MRPKTRGKNYKFISNLLLTTASLLAVFMLTAACSKTDNPDDQAQSQQSAETKKTNPLLAASDKNLETKEELDAETEQASTEEQDNAIPDSEIYIAKLKFKPGVIEIGPPVNITNNPGYDNQPFFLPDNNTILYASRRGDELNSQQTDVYAYFINSRKTSRMTDTPESEYSPTMTPNGETISVVRVELDSTQRLWEFPIQGKLTTNQDFEVVFPEITRVGYHSWVDEGNAFLFLVDEDPQGDQHTLELASRVSSATKKIATNIGRSFPMQPENNALAFIDKSNDKDWKIKRYGLEKTLAVELLSVLPGSEDMVWLDKEHILMGKDQNIYLNTIYNKYGEQWQQVSNYSDSDIKGDITRLAVSPDLKWLTFVVTK